MWTTESRRTYDRDGLRCRSDLTDAEWMIVAPMIPPAKRGGRPRTAKGFVVLSKRWIVERTFAWLGRCRRLAKEFECLARRALAFPRLAMIRLTMRRIARSQNQ